VRETPLSAIHLENMLAAYYKARDWDPVSGYPRHEKLLSLGLDWVADELWRRRKELKAG
jgi:aldehyde:ferredoxin oxidoreductase